MAKCVKGEGSKISDLRSDVLFGWLLKYEDGVFNTTWPTLEALLAPFNLIFHCFLLAFLRFKCDSFCLVNILYFTNICYQLICLYRYYQFLLAFFLDIMKNIRDFTILKLQRMENYREMTFDSSDVQETYGKLLSRWYLTNVQVLLHLNIFQVSFDHFSCFGCNMAVPIYFPTT